MSEPALTVNRLAGELGAELSGLDLSQPLRSGWLKHFVNRQPCLITMMACGGAHHWAREPWPVRGLTETGAYPSR
jgi:hypothetical protein